MEDPFKDLEKKWFLRHYVVFIVEVGLQLIRRGAILEICYYFQTLYQYFSLLRGKKYQIYTFFHKNPKEIVGVFFFFVQIQN